MPERKPPSTLILGANAATSHGVTRRIHADRRRFCSNPTQLDACVYNSSTLDNRISPGRCPTTPCRDISPVNYRSTSSGYSRKSADSSPNYGSALTLGPARENGPVREGADRSLWRNARANSVTYIPDREFSPDITPNGYHSQPVTPSVSTAYNNQNSLTAYSHHNGAAVGYGNPHRTSSGRWSGSSPQATYQFVAVAGEADGQTKRERSPSPGWGIQQSAR